MIIRDATPADAEAIRKIYAPYVTDTAISFEEEVPSVEDMAGRIATLQPKYGYHVAIIDGRIAGYAYGSGYRPRHAYRFTAEVSVYVDAAYQGKGLGRALYDVLIPDLKERGYHALIGIITLPNPASRRLHESQGFELIGITPQVGFKFDTWHDIGIFQKML